MMQELSYIRCGVYYIPDIRFNDLVLSGQLRTYLADLNEQAQERLPHQMKASESVTEDMKQHDQMA